MDERFSAWGVHGVQLGAAFCTKHLQLPQAESSQSGPGAELQPGLGAGSKVSKTYGAGESNKSKVGSFYFNSLGM